MTDHMPQAPLEIRKACPKLWSELVGDERKRHCSQCSLHVHDAAHLTRAQAQELVANSTSRVCMRIQYDQQGAPIFRDSNRAQRKPRLVRWALSAAAGLLAACHGSVPDPAAVDPAAGGIDTPSEMGKVYSTKMGDVAVPPPPRAVMGEASLPEPIAPPERPTPPVNGGGN